MFSRIRIGSPAFFSHFCRKESLKLGDKWDIHAWIYFSESSFPLLFHDNPEFVNYITAGY